MVVVRGGGGRGGSAIAGLKGRLTPAATDWFKK